MYIGKDVYYLTAGDIKFSDLPIKINTTLGSCMAITAWNPKAHKGGMCHFLLPYTLDDDSKKPDLYYGIHAVNTMKEKMTRDASLQDYEIGVYGGGSLFFSSSQTQEVAGKNIHLVFDWIEENNLNVVDQSIGGDECRTLVFDLATGNVDLRLHSPKNVHG